MKDYCKCLFTQLPLQTQSQEISQRPIFHHMVWHTQQCGDGALTAASAQSRAQGCYSGTSKVLGGLWCTSSLPLSCIPWLRHHRLAQRAPQESPAVGIMYWWSGDRCVMIYYDKSCTHCSWNRPLGSTGSQVIPAGRSFSFPKKGTAIEKAQMRRGRRQVSMPSQRCCCSWLPVGLINLSNLILVEISSLSPETCCCSVTPLFGTMFC